MATSKILKEYITEKRTAPAISITKSYYGEATVNAVKSGYKPIGVLSLSKSGASSGYCVISNYYFNSANTALTVGMMNTNTTETATVTVDAVLLYQRVGG